MSLRAKTHLHPLRGGADGAEMFLTADLAAGGQHSPLNGD